MKTSLPFIARVLALALAASSHAWAAAGTGPKAKIFAEFDANKNGRIDGDEVVAVQKAFDADPKGAFARYDVDHDGKLTEAEIAEIKPPGAKGAKGGDKNSNGKKEADTNTKSPDTK